MEERDIFAARCSYLPISASFVGSSDTVSSLERKLLMALKAWQEKKHIKTHNTWKKREVTEVEPITQTMPLETLCGESHVYLVPDTLIGVNSYSTEGGQDTGGDLCYTVVVVCGGEAQHTSGPWSWERVFRGSREGGNKNTLSSLRREDDQILADPCH